VNNTASTILHFGGPLTREQYEELKAWWADPRVRQAYLNEPIIPNRLYGAQINADGEAV
jgi:hypothetical protein